MLLVTGATGFIGKNLIPELSKTRTLRILVRHTSNIKAFKENTNIEIAYGDLEQNVGIEDALSGVDTVIHCAARTIGKNFAEYYQTNTNGTKHLIRAMNKKNVTKILHISSHAVCGPCCGESPLKEIDEPKPISFYGVSKKIAEDIIIKSGIHYTILRPVAIYGPHDMEILKYIKFLHYGICPIIGFGEKRINLIYVVDLVQLIVTIVREDNFGDQIYFVNDGNCYAFKDVVNKLAQLLNNSNLKIYIPERIAQFYGLLNDVFLPEKKRLIWRDKVKELAKSYWLCYNEKLTAECNFTPKYNLEQGMKETITWYRAHGFLN